MSRTYGLLLSAQDSTGPPVFSIPSVLCQTCPCRLQQSVPFASFAAIEARVAACSTLSAAHAPGRCCQRL